MEPPTPRQSFKKEKAAGDTAQFSGCEGLTPPRHKVSSWSHDWRRTENLTLAGLFLVWLFPVGLFLVGSLDSG